MAETDTACFYLGKSGSSTVIGACESLGFHCSRAYDELHHTQKDYRYIISLAREPVARNLSAFFDESVVAWGEHGAPQTTEELTEAFLQRWPDRGHQRPLAWWRGNFEAELGLDVFAHRFPRRKGWAVHEAGGKRVLIIRMDMLTKKLGKALAELYALPGDTWPVVQHRAKGEEKYAHGVGELYVMFLAEVCLPVWYLDRMYGSEYAEHFWFGAELKRFRKRWECK